MQETTHQGAGPDDTGTGPATPAIPAEAAARPRAWSTLFALLALAVSAASAGYAFWSGRAPATDPGIEALKADLAARTSALDALGARLDELTTARRNLEDEFSRLGGQFASDSEALQTLPDRVSQIEQSIARFVGVGDGVRAAWLLSEAEHYMRIANAQLGLAGDTGVAQTALALADETLRELADPRLTPVRKRLSQEMQALRAVPQPDVEGIVLSLGNLADRLERFPARHRAPESFRGTPAETPAELTGTDRALMALRNAFRSLVSVRRTDVPVTPLLPEADHALLVRSLDIELQIARLALMRGDAGMFRRSLAAATSRLEQNFDTTAREVQAALATLEELADTELPEGLPDISGSLAALLEVTAGDDAR